MTFDDTRAIRLGIRLARLDWSASHLAERMGVRPNLITRWKQGAAGELVSTATLARVLHVEASALEPGGDMVVLLAG